MFAKSKWQVVFAMAVFVATAGIQVCSAQNCSYPDVLLGGIWLYPEPFTNWTLTVINLTPYTLTSTPRSTTPDAVSVFGAGGYDYPFENLLEPISVDPYRSVIWKSRMSQLTSHNNYYGRIRFHIVAQSSENTFELNFDHQNGYATAGIDGTWIALAQTKVDAPTEWTNDQWCSAGLFCGDVFATTWMKPLKHPTGSVDMRNLMTLTTGKLVVALYSPNNRDVVLVVRDTWDGPDPYEQIKSEWVDNNGPSVPGSCNRSPYLQ